MQFRARQARSLALSWGAALVAVLSFGCHDIDIDYTRGEAGEILIFDDLYSVSAPDEKHAVAVGYYGAAYYTNDGGLTWEKGNTGTLTSLYNVSMGDADHGWAVGQRGLILRTEDGGKTWTEQETNKQKEGAHLFSVTAIDKDRAWAVGAWGTRIYTEDGGKTWRDDSFTINERHPMFVWLSPAEKERVRNNLKVYDDVSLNDVFCLPGTQRCWLIGEFGYLYYSVDGGETWQQSQIEGSAEMEPLNVPYNTLRVVKDDVPKLEAFAEAVRDEGHLNVAIEAVASPEEIEEFGDPEDPSELFEILEARMQEVRTVLENAGVPTDRVRLRGQPPWDFEEYLEDDPRFLDRYLESRVASQPGTRVRVIQNPILFTVRFEDENNGLISGLGGVILRTEDGGETWEYRRIDRTQALFSVDARDGKAFAVGEKGLIRVSPDGGESWTEPRDDAFPEIFTFMRDIAFSPDGSVGFIVGQTGQILRTDNGGHSWEQVLERG